MIDRNSQFTKHESYSDVKWDNVMMDSLHLYDEPVHPTRKDMKRNFRGPAKKPRTRTERPVNYYLVDFGRSRLYDRKSGPPRQYSGQEGYGGDKSVPEFRIPGYYDPFLIDVYRAGNLIREIKSVRPLLRLKSRSSVLNGALAGRLPPKPWRDREEENTRLRLLGALVAGHVP